MKLDIVTLLRTADGFDLVSETMNEGADEIERLREALRFYAEPGCYTFIPMVKADGSFFISSIVVRDGGEKARTALGEKE